MTSHERPIDIVCGPDDASAALGDMLWLYSLSKVHHSWPIASLHKWILPPLKLGQYRLYYVSMKPVGFVTWAWMDATAEYSYVRNNDNLEEEHWKSGDRLWAIDLVAPFRHATMIAKDLRQNQFPNDIARFLRAKAGSDKIRIAYAHGAKAIDKARDPQQNSPVLF